MKIHLYALCWNEEKMLPFFFQHYEAYVDQFFIYDHQSTDHSRQILKQHPKVSLSDFSVPGDSFVLAAKDFYNNAWKNSRGIADWVIVCNVDEHFYHPNLYDILDYYMKNNISIIPSKGYEMITDEYPSKPIPLYQQIHYGVPTKSCDKIACFNPNLIKEINFSEGRHRSNPKGKVFYPDKLELKLLHFKALGLDFLISRYAELFTGLKAIDRERGYGAQYLWDKKRIREYFEKMKSQAVEVPLSDEHELGYKYLLWKLKKSLLG